MVELSLLRIVVVDITPQLRIKIRPFLKPERLPEYARSYVPCYQCRLDGDGAGTAHRIIEIALPAPSGYQQHSGSQHLIDRSFGRRYTVSALMQTLAAAVQTDRQSLFCNMYVDIQIRIGHFHVRTLAAFLYPPVCYRVFHAVGHKTAVPESLAVNRRINGKSRVL